MEINTAMISVICILVGSVLGILTYKRAFIKDVQAEAKNNAVLDTKLDFISQGVNSIQIKMDSQEAKFGEMNIRVTRVEESSKQAHKRIDEIDGKLEHERK